MPGIVGLITRKPRQHAEQELLDMVATMCHEPFYSTGTWIDETLGIYVGWIARRNSFSEGMPLRNEDGQVVLVFSGENFPEPGTADRLKQRGHLLGEQTASYLVHLYEDDPSFPTTLNGRFQGLLVDRRKGTTSLFNDRYGMHRIYYHASSQAFYFAAEAKAILAVRPEFRTLDSRGLGEYVACGCVLEDRTLFKGIHALPPASKWVFRNASIERKGDYFSPIHWEQQAQLEPEAYYQSLREVFSQNLPRYFDGDQPIAMSLTGGLDTRMIMAWHKSPQGSLPCYSFGGTFRDSRDVVVARRVARACRQPYKVIAAGDEFFREYPSWAERAVYVTDGCAPVSTAADLYLNEQARQIAPIRMTGNYGGEVLRRVRALKAVQPTTELFDRELTRYFRQALQTHAEITRGHPLSFVAFRQVPWHHYGLLALEETKLSIRTPFLDNDLVRTVFRAPDSVLTNGPSLRLIGEGDPALQKIPTDRGLADRRAGATARRLLLELTFKTEYAYDYGMPQWLARVDALLAPFRPERFFLGRHKFKHYRVWYRDRLSKYVKEMLLDRQTLSRPYLRAKTVESMVLGHLRGDRNYTSQIHQILTLEVINRRLLSSPPTGCQAPAALAKL